MALIAIIALVILGVNVYTQYQESKNQRLTFDPNTGEATVEDMKAFLCGDEQQWPWENIIYLLCIAALVGVLMGGFVYWLMASQVAMREQYLSKSTGIILAELRPDERIMVERLVEKGGQAAQTDLSRITGMTKLKAHRTLAKLEERGIVTRVSKGKTKQVTLARAILDSLSK